MGADEEPTIQADVVGVAEPVRSEGGESLSLRPKSFADAVRDEGTEQIANGTTNGATNGYDERGANGESTKVEADAAADIPKQNGDDEQDASEELKEAEISFDGDTGNNVDDKKDASEESQKEETSVDGDTGKQLENGELPKAERNADGDTGKDGEDKQEASEESQNSKADSEGDTGKEKGQGNGRNKPTEDHGRDYVKSYAAAASLQPLTKQSARERRSRHANSRRNDRTPSPGPSLVSVSQSELFEDTEFEDSDIFTNYPSPSNTSERLVSMRPRSRPSTSTYHTDSSSDEDRTLVSGREAGKNWHQSKIRFAPLNIPLQRRLQTAMVLAHTLCIAILIGSFLFMCAIPILWPIILPYMIYIMFSKAGYSGELSHRSESLRRSKLWSLFAGYFPARLHRTTELSPTRKYIFGYHPHGIISHGAFAAFATEALGFSQLFPGITNTLLTLDSNFRIPLYRDYALALGLGSVSRQSCENILSKGGLNGEGMGRAITIVVGGARESLAARPHTMRLVLRRRYGFVKMAMRTGADLVPVLGFGENELYDQLSAEGRPWIRRGQDLLKRTLGWTLPLFHARGVFNYDVGLVPYRRAVNVVVGRPVKVEQNRMPSVEEVEEVHARYCEELVRVWETWKEDFAAGRREEMRIGD